MYLVAVCTISAQETAPTFGIFVPGIIICADMAATVRADLRMALLAELCALFFQQSFVNRAVCAVTQAAVFCHRIVLPKVGTTLLRMTLVTVVIQAQLLEHRGTVRTMGIVAVTTHHFAFPDGVSGSLVSLGAYVVMAGITDLGLGRSVHGQVGFVHIVAGCAGQFLGLMQAGMPLYHAAALVTLGTHNVLCIDR